MKKIMTKTDMKTTLGGNIKGWHIENFSMPRKLVQAEVVGTQMALMQSFSYNGNGTLQWSFTISR